MNNFRQVSFACAGFPGKQDGCVLSYDAAHLLHHLHGLGGQHEKGGIRISDVRLVIFAIGLLGQQGPGLGLESQGAQGVRKPLGT